MSSFPQVVEYKFISLSQSPISLNRLQVLEKDPESEAGEYGSGLPSGK
jgi:hypothetical protein